MEGNKASFLSTQELLENAQANLVRISAHVLLKAKVLGKRIGYEPKNILLGTTTSGHPLKMPIGCTQAGLLGGRQGLPHRMC